MNSFVKYRGITTRRLGRRIIRSFTTGAIPKQEKRGEDKKPTFVYELRTYSLQPNKMREYLDLTAKEFHIRTAHSKLVGFWTSEIGGLNEVVHIWEYGSLSERADVRARLAADSEWIGRYFSRILPMLQSQNNVLLTLIPGTQLSLPSSKGIYELQTLQMQGASSLWPRILSQWTQTCMKANNNAGTNVVGVWRSVLGPRQMAVILWQHLGPDGCIDLADTATALPEEKTLAPFLTNFHSKLLLPHVVSPLQ